MSVAQAKAVPGAEAIERFVRTLPCEVITPQDAHYDEARQIYNRFHDMYPAALVRTLDHACLRQVLSFAMAQGVELAIRGGGHHIGGLGTSHQGIVIDFSPFQQVQLDAANGVVHVQPGATLKALDEALCPHGWVVPTGTVSQTGLGGLTLGGGIGWLVGAYGLTCDNLVGADVMLADGSVVRAGEGAHKDLLWALRGGGGNFGVVLSYTYRLNRLPDVCCGAYRVQWSRVPDVLARLVEFMLQRCPPQLTIAPAFLRDADGEPYLSIDFCGFEACPDGLRELADVAAGCEPDDIRRWDFADWQSSFDANFLPPMRGYWKAKYLTQLTAADIALLITHYEQAPRAARCTITLEHLHGAFREMPCEESAFGHRQMNFGVLISTRWPTPADDPAHVRWVRGVASELDPHGRCGSYVNYSPLDKDDQVSSLYGDHHQKLKRLKGLYDPQNLFRRKHNL